MKRVHRRGAFSKHLEVIAVCGQFGRVRLTNIPENVTCLRCLELSETAVGQVRIYLGQMA